MIPFDRVQHLVRVPVLVGGDEYRFLVDTGIGITVVSSTVATRAGVRQTGDWLIARRMSGQEVRAPLVRLPEVSLGGHTVVDHLACVSDLGEDFAGILGPGFYAGSAITTDPTAMTLMLRDSAEARGYEVPLLVRREGVTVDAFVNLVLPSGRQVSVEVDTGSDNLILDPRFAVDCGVDLDGPGVTTTTGTDETGYQWTRRWATAGGPIHLAAAPQTVQEAARVQFQDIIYDGLIGTDYLYRYRFTIDFDRARMFLENA
jgi:hypothetical protein